MKLAVRIFVLTIVFTGVAAAVSPSTSIIPSHQSATGPLPRPDTLPGPVCMPGIPGCIV
jgi:hypothetical protein